jgi:triphosphoribosyl-dephospho-CoA synthase
MTTQRRDDASMLVSTHAAITPQRVREAAQLACLLEVSAPKPGNVSPGRHFGDLRYEDFLASAIAIGEPLAGAAQRGLGATIRLAVESTFRWTRSNTNLGIVLLFAPIARASLTHAAGDLRLGVGKVLESTTVEDAVESYAAIRLARPGGLDRVERQDVSTVPTATLLEVMSLAAHRDTIAREYATSFDTIFGEAVPALRSARRDGLSWDDAVVETFVVLLTSALDTHIVRRSGGALARQVRERARRVMEQGGVRTQAGRDELAAMDLALRDARNSGNPGTTADLTAAAIFVVLLEGGFHATR